MKRFAQRLRRGAVDLLGAVVVVLFARASIQYYLQTHRLFGLLFVIQQLWVAAAFLIRRPARSVSGRPLDWIAAVGGSFGGFLLRPAGLHPEWGVVAGLALQVVGITLWAVSFATLGRSFGLVAADRGLVTSGPYAVVRHPLYIAYLVSQFGYFLQSVSFWNALVLVLTWTCQVIRALAEERHLSSTTWAYDDYRTRVRWRLMPGVW